MMHRLLKTYFKAVIIITIMSLPVYAQALETEAGNVLSSMKEVADWQLANPVRFDITVKGEGSPQQLSILWDGTFVRERERANDEKVSGNFEKGWNYLGKLVRAPVSFHDLPSAVQKTFSTELKQDPSEIIKVEMCDKDTRGWEMGAFFIGLEALAQTSGDQKYIDALNLIADANDWKLGERIYHADDHCVGQMYLYLHSIHNELNMIADLQMQFDWIIENPHPQSLDYSEGKNRWSWCDALFMSPPAWLYLTNTTGKLKYLKYMNDHYWQTYEHLYDKEEHLFYRDDRYYDRRETNGEKVFWSRGNGWVLAGLARMIDNFPQNFEPKNKYIQLYKEIISKIKDIQPSDGMYRASLLDPESYPAKEASGTAFFIYAAAWGVNNGYIDKSEYLPFIAKSWKSLQNCINEDGKLGWTQLPGSEPGDVKAQYNAPYGVGAYLLAGSEVYNLLTKK